MALRSNQWVFPKEFIEDRMKPNVKKSREYHSKTVWFLTDLAMSLRMDRMVISTASVYLHRFYLFHSFEQQNRFLVTVACLFLAAKVEEKAMKIKDIVYGYYAVKMDNLQPAAKDVENTIKEAILMERILLNTLNFDLTVVHPYEFCQKKLREVRNYIPQESMKDFAGSMYSIVNDSYRSTLCLEYQPEDVAMAAFYIASIQLSIRPTSVGSRDKSWVEILEADIQEFLLRAISMEIIEMYDQKTYILAARERIEAELLGQKLNTVSNSTTPNVSTPGSTMLGAHDMFEEERPEHRKITVTVFEKQQQRQSIILTEAVKLELNQNTVSPISVHPALDGSDSSVSHNGFPDDTPVYNQNSASETPTTPRFDSLPKFQMRERSNSLTEYSAYEAKRTRAE